MIEVMWVVVTKWWGDKKTHTTAGFKSFTLIGRWWWRGREVGEVSWVDSVLRITEWNLVFNYCFFMNISRFDLLAACFERQALFNACGGSVTCRDGPFYDGGRSIPKNAWPVIRQWRTSREFASYPLTASYCSFTRVESCRPVWPT